MISNKPLLLELEIGSPFWNNNIYAIKKFEKSVAVVLIVSVLDSGLIGTERWPASILGQNTLPLQCLSPPRCNNGDWRI